MDKKTAQILFVVFNILAILAVGYCIVDYIDISQAIDDKLPAIPFDTGTYYLLLMSVFWVLAVVQILGVRNKSNSAPKWAGAWLLGWFIFCLLLANVIPYQLTQSLIASGYVPCDNPAEISRVSRGESNIYQLDTCVAVDGAVLP
jgi:hypothetical protein